MRCERESTHPTVTTRLPFACRKHRSPIPLLRITQRMLILRRGDGFHRRDFFIQLKSDFLSLAFERNLSAMADRSEDLRKEAARCLEAAKQSRNPNSVSELAGLAAKFLELADYRPFDLDAILAEYNLQQMVPPKSEGGRSAARAEAKAEEGELGYAPLVREPRAALRFARLD